MMKWNVVSVVVAAGLFVAAPAEAQLGFGVQGSYGTEVEGLGIGARVVAPVGQNFSTDASSPLSRLRVIGSFDWFFPDCPDGFDCGYFEINGNAAVPFAMEGMTPYAGAGLNIARGSIESEDDGPFEIDESDTEVGLNLLAGIELPLGGLNTFAEGRLELGGGENFVITLGVLF